jgi:hypothetical protein
MSIGLAAERIAESLRNDEWFWHSSLDDQRVFRKGMTLSVSLRGEVKVGNGNGLPGNPVPMNRSERKMLARIAKETLQKHIASIANSPTRQG